MMNRMTEHKSKKKHIFINTFIFLLSTGVLLGAALMVWVGMIEIPDFNSFDARKIERSTKIYDNTGEILLYDVHQDIKRTVVPFTEISDNIKKATVAIEDSNFYQHQGIQPKAILRAVLVNVLSVDFSQGGSTITQQIIKNTLLTKDKTITRKVKEWILAVKIEQQLSKEDILGIYLNEVPYGGSVYGVEEASRTFFNKKARDLTLAESAYIAAIPQAPTRYSPYGKNKELLDTRKNVVLSRMKELGFITEDEMTTAKAEQVVFIPREATGLKAPHFVMFIREYLEQKYGKDAIEGGGLKVITTLDYDIQKKAEEVALKNALENAKTYNATNTGVVVLDPKTGHILSMVGSRDYFDKEIDGNFNITTARRQPGSSFKPFIYATAFMKGYTPETVLFDVPTEFQASCDAYGNPKGGRSKNDCYMPQNYNGLFHGPMMLRDALAQSINVPAVKLLYLTSIKDSLKTAKDMGIKSLTNPEQYGLTLVLGGGEVSLLDMASAYGVFANEGIRVPATGVLRIETETGQVLEQYTQQEQQVLSKNVALMISDILSDNQARTPTFGANSTLNVSDDVAVKTGTTNSNKDAWMIGYSPSVVVGVWSGNNENTPMKKGSTVSGPTFNQVMKYALSKMPRESFEKPSVAENYDSLIPPLRGKFLGGESFIIDTISGKLATDLTPSETRKEKVITNIHSILHWVDKSNPTGGIVSNPQNDSQYNNWETAVQNWWRSNSGQYQNQFVSASEKPNDFDDIHTVENKPRVQISLNDTQYSKSETVDISVSSSGRYPLRKIEVYLNGIYIDSVSQSPFTYSIDLSSIDDLSEENEVKIKGYDTVYNNNEEVKYFTLTGE
ncbi:MAG: PBP1A family penicillin-binding protein [Candidatus Pacebacteria bacterium]|nr:PBP1A family penicillin-binding protein [Candidatus Paceibacterota bacterium]MBP9780932.1 PBP1A family penicillin-binding protein [Candidatus Paceibacterota bacterium]